MVVRIVYLVMDIKQESEIPGLSGKWVLYEFPDGTTIIADAREIRRDRPGVPSGYSTHKTAAPDAKIWVKSTEGRIFEFDEGNFRINEKKAVAMAALWFRSGGFEIEKSPSLIPVEIAVLGKPSIATYLDTTQDVDRDEISKMLEVSEETVEQYVSKVRQGHR